MSRHRSRETFNAREMKYLESLPAVTRVTPERIWYSRSFKHECIRRYNAGESPIEIFQSAGLDSSLIGYKRIERSIARWKARYSDDGISARPALRRRREHADPIPFPTGDRNKWFDATSLLVILQQARRIDELERELERLRHSAGRSSGRGNDGGEG